MIATVHVEEKSFGDKRLFHDLKFSIQDGEKVGLIGRNGEGKTTLFRILSGDDADFQGDITFRRGLTTIATRQEHHGFEDVTVMHYILNDLPEYAGLKHIMDTYPTEMGSNMKKIHEYSNALERFDELGYYTIEEDVLRVLSTFQLTEVAERMLSEISGGQKRLVEVAKVMLSRAHLALVDEPTNHMDFAAKEKFIRWMVEAQEAVVVITHDRDVLANVDRIIELKDKKATNFNGNYDRYITQNASSTGNQMNEFELTQRRIANLKAKVIEYQRFKEKARDPGTIQRFKRLEAKTREALANLQDIEKPTFWIDRDSVTNMGLKTGEQYEKFKAKNIRLHGAKTVEGRERLLIDVQKISLGYGDTPLFRDVQLQVREGETVELRGRNGTGKTTLIKTLLSIATHETPAARIFAGELHVGQKIRVGVYEQEIEDSLFTKTLYEAIEWIYLSRDLSIGETKIRQLVSDYLFTPGDMAVPVGQLSGGQKARLQLIAMLANNPSLLVLDEPTNHLDLPSIEEMEHALQAYKGAILYVSHDSYFQKAIGGTVIEIASRNK